MIIPDWLTLILLCLEVLVTVYGFYLAIVRKQSFGWFLGLAFLLFSVRGILPYAGVEVSTGTSLAMAVAALASVVVAYYLQSRKITL